MRRFIFKFSVLSGMLLGLPLVGVVLVGHPIRRYLEFPPISRYIDHAPFSWAVFCGYALFTLIFILPLMVKGLKSKENAIKKTNPTQSFPWWGWVGVGFGIVFWIIAWNRFAWFAALQAHTFTPLWISYIVIVNALTFRRTGRCMMLERTGFFLVLFPFSALFWWFFEYLNRFVQNWYYVGVEFDPVEYFWYATLSFSTVLPAVLGTRQWIASFDCLQHRFNDFIPLKIARPGIAAALILALSGIGLAGIGIRPNLLFPLLWISPLLIVVSLQALAAERQVLSDIAQGDWRLVITSASAALICGIFWETWNYHSLAKWIYTVPYVHRFEIFEMPLLGFAGYLPFGLECVTVGILIENLPVFSKRASIFRKAPPDV